MVFERTLPQPLGMPAIFISNAESERVSQYTLLAFLFEENLNFNQHKQFKMRKRYSQLP